ncbi:MAG TPA: hypothetical protein VL461_01425 [Dictyobacter sp.]|jgi:hypothetical protein|nr:hypothetical protein [Dictyobacter sp.]
MPEKQKNMFSSDESELTSDEHKNLVALWKSVELSMQEIEPTNIPIGPEYCWMHDPGGWCCPVCYAERTPVGK